MNNTLCKKLKFNGENYVSITTQFVRMLIQMTSIAVSVLVHQRTIYQTCIDKKPDEATELHQYNDYQDNSSIE